MTRERHHGCGKRTQALSLHGFIRRLVASAAIALTTALSLSAVEHPFLWWTQEDLTSIKKRVETEEVAQQQWEDQEMVFER